MASATVTLRDTRQGTRFREVDALRGFIMIVMAIDHSNAFIARQHSAEFWAGAMSSYSSAFPFLTRWITHLCAPGFFFLMGAGIYWFAQSRKQMGWTDGRVMRRVAWRGLALLLVGQFLENPVMILQSLLKGPAVRVSMITQPPPLDGSQLFWTFIVISCLGMVMMCCSLLLRWGVGAWAAAGVAAVIVTNTFLPASGKPGPLWECLLLAPGISHHLLVVYPVIPWLGVAAFGMCFGYWWKANPEKAPKLVPLVGLALLFIGLGLRAAGGWGNIRLPRDSGWIEFLNSVKYPPALVFWTVSVGIDLMILGLLIRLPDIVKTSRSPLIVFGQTPLFFYLAHLYLFAAIGWGFFREPAPLWVAYPVWLAALFVLYPACLWYRRFKQSKPVESVWRLF